jgi:hypothetical protein
MCKASFQKFLLIAALLISCKSESDRQIPAPVVNTEASKTPNPYVITDYKDKARGGRIPGWVSTWLDLSVHDVEDLYPGSFVFIYRNEGNNFSALNLWKDGFQAELDFPRLAAARIEERFNSASYNPDEEYGAFFIDLIRAVSDRHWEGAVRAGDFWISKKYLSGAAGQETGSILLDGREIWEFMILVTIDKPLFASQLEAIFQNLKPFPPPSRNQNTAINRVKNRFYEGF